MRRKIYIRMILITFLVGFLLFSVLAYFEKIKGEISMIFDNNLMILLYGFLGSWMLISFLTAIYFFVIWFKKVKAGLRIFSIVFFPLSMMIFVFCGIWGCLPYFIFNVVKMKKDKLAEISDKNTHLLINQEITKKKIICSILFLSLIFAYIFQEMESMFLFIFAELIMVFMLLKIGLRYNKKMENKLNDILLKQCNAKEYTAIIKYSAETVGMHNNMRKNSITARQIIGCFLYGDKEMGIQLYEELPQDYTQYYINEQKYFYMSKILYSIIMNKYENIKDLIEKYINAKGSIIDKSFWTCVLHYLNREYNLLGTTIQEAENTNILLLKQYLWYMQGEGLYSEGKLELAKEKYQLVCENGGELEIVKISAQRLNDIDN